MSAAEELDYVRQEDSSCGDSSGPKMSRAERRRQRVLARGTDRLQRIGQSYGVERTEQAIEEAEGERPGSDLAKGKFFSSQSDGDRFPSQSEARASSMQSGHSEGVPSSKSSSRAEEPTSFTPLTPPPDPTPALHKLSSAWMTSLVLVLHSLVVVGFGGLFRRLLV